MKCPRCDKKMHHMGDTEFWCLDHGTFDSTTRIRFPSPEEMKTENRRRENRTKY